MSFKQNYLRQFKDQIKVLSCWLFSGSVTMLGSEERSLRPAETVDAWYQLRLCLKQRIEGRAGVKLSEIRKQHQVNQM